MCSRELTVSFTGSVGPASEPCGADYTGLAVESANAVVIVVAHPHATGEVALKDITRHILGLYQGCHGARGYRRLLSTEAYKPGAGISVVRAALELVTRSRHDNTPPDLAAA